MSELRERFGEDDEPSILVFLLSSSLRKYPYEALALGMSVTLTFKWDSQLRPLFSSQSGPQWQSWTSWFALAGQSDFLLPTALILIVSSGKLRTGIARALRMLIGLTAGIWLMSSLLIYRWISRNSFSSLGQGIGLVQGLVVAAIHLLTFWWATDPRTLRPYAGVSDFHARI